MIFGAILAGGTGKRMDKHNIPKQFIDLCGKPIIIHTIQKMVSVKEFDFIFIAIHPDYKEYLQKTLESFNLSDNSKIVIIDGGKERIDSIENVINAAYELNHNAEDIIVLHDAVRPFVSQKILQDSIATASKYGACVAIVPAVDTIYFHDSDTIIDFPERSKLCNGQSPDSFKIGILKKSLEQLSENERKTITGTVQICSFKGFPVKTIPGDYQNIKITTENDLLLAEVIYKKEVINEGLCATR